MPMSLMQSPYPSAPYVASISPIKRKTLMRMSPASRTSERPHVLPTTPSLPQLMSVCSARSKVHKELDEKTETNNAKQQNKLLRETLKRYERDLVEAHAILQKYGVLHKLRMESSTFWDASILRNEDSRRNKMGYNIHLSNQEIQRIISNEQKGIATKPRRMESLKYLYKMQQSPQRETMLKMRNIHAKTMTLQSDALDQSRMLTQMLHETQQLLTARSERSSNTRRSEKDTSRDLLFPATVSSSIPLPAPSGLATSLSAPFLPSSTAAAEKLLGSLVSNSLPPSPAAAGTGGGILSSLSSCFLPLSPAAAAGGAVRSTAGAAIGSAADSAAGSHSNFGSTSPVAALYSGSPTSSSSLSPLPAEGASGAHVMVPPGVELSGVQHRIAKLDLSTLSKMGSAGSKEQIQAEVEVQQLMQRACHMQEKMERVYQSQLDAQEEMEQLTTLIDAPEEGTAGVRGATDQEGAQLRLDSDTSQVHQNKQQQLGVAGTAASAASTALYGGRGATNQNMARSRNGSDSSHMQHLGQSSENKKQTKKQERKARKQRRRARKQRRREKRKRRNLKRKNWRMQSRRGQDGSGNGSAGEDEADAAAGADDDFEADVGKSWTYSDSSSSSSSDSDDSNDSDSDHGGKLRRVPALAQRKLIKKQPEIGAGPGTRSRQLFEDKVLKRSRRYMLKWYTMVLHSKTSFFVKRAFIRWRSAVSVLEERLGGRKASLKASLKATGGGDGQNDLLKSMLEQTQIDQLKLQLVQRKLMMLESEHKRVLALLSKHESIAAARRAKARLSKVLIKDLKGKRQGMSMILASAPAHEQEVTSEVRNKFRAARKKIESLSAMDLNQLRHAAADAAAVVEAVRRTSQQYQEPGEVAVESFSMPPISL